MFGHRRDDAAGVEELRRALAHPGGPGIFTPDTRSLVETANMIRPARQQSAEHRERVRNLLANAPRPRGAAPLRTATGTLDGHEGGGDLNVTHVHTDSGEVALVDVERISPAAAARAADRMRSLLVEAGRGSRD